MTEWQQAKTAPRDGSKFLSGGRNIIFGITHFARNDFWCNGFDHRKMTHWMPLPPLPPGSSECEVNHE